jgi:trehalose 6-phosphate phosphatase
VSAPTADRLADALSPLTDDPSRSAVFCDIDGTLAPIVERAEEARVPEEVSVLLARLGRRYRCVACISGRSAAEARRLVGVGGIFYAGSHGAELLEPA